MRNAPHLRPYQFQPGQSGNPGGRPRTPLRERLLRKLLEEDATVGAIVEAIIERAKQGDVRAFTPIRDTAIFGIAPILELA